MPYDCTRRRIPSNSSLDSVGLTNSPLDDLESLEGTLQSLTRSALLVPYAGNLGSSALAALFVPYALCITSAVRCMLCVLPASFPD